MQKEVAGWWSKAGVDNVDKIGNFSYMSRLTIEIDPQQHRQIKTLATFAGMTIKEFVIAKTLGSSEPVRQNEGDTTETLLASSHNALRLREAIAEETPGHLHFDSVEDLRHALGT